MTTSSLDATEGTREVKNRQVVAGMYEALSRGDAEAVLLTLSADIEWVVVSGLPYGGTYRGRDAVLANVFSRFDTDWEGFAVDPAELFAVDDVVIALGHYRGRGRASGTPMAARFAHVCASSRARRSALRRSRTPAAWSPPCRSVACPNTGCRTGSATLGGLPAPAPVGPR